MLIRTRAFKTEHILDLKHTESYSIEDFNKRDDVIINIEDISSICRDRDFLLNGDILEYNYLVMKNKETWCIFDEDFSLIDNYIDMSTSEVIRLCQ